MPVIPAFLLFVQHTRYTPFSGLCTSCLLECSSPGPARLTPSPCLTNSHLLKRPTLNNPFKIADHPYIINTTPNSPCPTLLVSFFFSTHHLQIYYGIYFFVIYLFSLKCKLLASKVLCVIHDIAQVPEFGHRGGAQKCLLSKYTNK